MLVKQLAQIIGPAYQRFAVFEKLGHPLWRMSDFFIVGLVLSCGYVWAWVISQHWGGQPIVWRLFDAYGYKPLRYALGRQSRILRIRYMPL